MEIMLNSFASNLILSLGKGKHEMEVQKIQKTRKNMQLERNERWNVFNVNVNVIQTSRRERENPNKRKLYKCTIM